MTVLVMAEASWSQVIVASVTIVAAGPLLMLALVLLDRRTR